MSAPSFQSPFVGIEPVRFAGAESTAPLSFRYYDKNRRDGRLLGKTRIILRRMGSSEIPD